MDCLKTKCQHYSPEKSKQYCCDFCTITASCLLGRCPIDSMIRFCEDRLEGLRGIKRYLEGI